MNALSKALADTERSYFSAKASVSAVTGQMLAQGPGGVLTQHKDLFLAKEQLLHYTGWVYLAVEIMPNPLVRPTIRRQSRIPVCRREVTTGGDTNIARGCECEATQTAQDKQGRPRPASPAPSPCRTACA